MSVTENFRGGFFARIKMSSGKGVSTGRIISCRNKHERRYIERRAF